MDFVLLDSSYHSQLLSLWCILNTSWAGPLLSGGVGLSALFWIAGKILTGLPQTEEPIISLRNKYFRRRRRVLALGIFACLGLLVTAILYVICADSLRAMGPNCETAKASLTCIK